MRTKPKWDEAIKRLRTVLARTQSEFAVLIGASKDTVVSWENKRSVEVSRQFIQRIRMATGATVAADGTVKAPTGQPFTAEYFQYWRKRFAPNAKTLSVIGADSLNLILQAAETPRTCRVKDRLPAVWVSFAEWLQQARDNFDLGAEIDDLLKKRSRMADWTSPYGVWRAMSRAEQKELGFKDDPKKSDTDIIALRVREHPEWQPGADMR